MQINLDNFLSNKNKNEKKLHSLENFLLCSGLEGYVFPKIWNLYLLLVYLLYIFLFFKYVGYIGTQKYIYATHSIFLIIFLRLICLLDMIARYNLWFKLISMKLKCLSKISRRIHIWWWWWFHICKWPNLAINIYYLMDLINTPVLLIDRSINKFMLVNLDKFLLNFLFWCSFWKYNKGSVFIWSSYVSVNLLLSWGFWPKILTGWFSSTWRIAHASLGPGPCNFLLKIFTHKTDSQNQSFFQISCL